MALGGTPDGAIGPAGRRVRGWGQAPALRFSPGAGDEPQRYGFLVRARRRWAALAVQTKCVKNNRVLFW